LSLCRSWACLVVFGAVEAHRTKNGVCLANHVVKLGLGHLDPGLGAVEIKREQVDEMRVVAVGDEAQLLVVAIIGCGVDRLLCGRVVSVESNRDLFGDRRFD